MRLPNYHPDHHLAGGPGHVRRVVSVWRRSKDGGTLEDAFETDEQNVPQSVTKEKVEEIAA